MYATRVADGVYLLDTVALGQPGVVGAFVVKADKPVLVDCGYASSHGNVLAGLAEVGLSPSDIRYVIPTHVHLDHGGAAGHLMQAMPNAHLLAHERAVPHLADPTRLVESATKVFGKAIMDMYGPPLPVPVERITALGSETHLPLGGGLTATVMHAPGHAPHQVSVLVEKAGVLLTADAVGIVYPAIKALIPTTPPPSFDPEALVRTVGRLEQTAPRELLVPHFGSRDDPGEVFEGTKREVLGWVREVGELRNRGLGLDEITQRMQERVAREAGVGSLPVYAMLSIRTSVMGITHYLEKNA